jgi:hypothetical protein
VSLGYVYLVLIKKKSPTSQHSQSFFFFFFVYLVMFSSDYNSLFSLKQVWQVMDRPTTQETQGGTVIVVCAQNGSLTSDTGEVLT